MANAPYVPSAALELLPAESRRYEAPVALDGGPDGLAVLRRLAEEAARWLAPGGNLVVEVGESQVDPLAAVLRAAGLIPTTVRNESLGATAMTARRPVDMAGSGLEN